MKQVCLSCLNKLSEEDKLYKLGNEVYHESCYTNKVISKAIKYANQIKSLEPEQIVAQLYGTDKFKLTDEEKAIIKSQQIISVPSNVSGDMFEQMGFGNFKANKQDIQNALDNAFNNFNLSELDINDMVNTHFNSIYDQIITKSEIPNIQNTLTKEDFKLFMDSTASITLSDFSLIESAMKSKSHDAEELIVSKILEKLPQELQTKLANLKTQAESYPTQQTFVTSNTNIISNTIANADTESDTEELLNQINQIKKNFKSNDNLDNDNNLPNFEIPELD